VLTSITVWGIFALHNYNDMHITVYRRRKDGSWPTVGNTDIAVFTQYKTYKNALRYAILPYLQGGAGRVEIPTPDGTCIMRLVNMQKISAFV